MNSLEEALVFLRSVNTDRVEELRMFVARHQNDGDLDRETWTKLGEALHHLSRLEGLRTYFGVCGMKRKKRVLVTGGRRYDDKVHVYNTLSDIVDSWGPIFIIQGGATGADKHARDWAADNFLPCATVDAAWKKGNLAGPKRNGWMVELEPDLCVSFPGGRGTANCVKQAKEAFVTHYDAGER